jgi:hypothetical protein
MPILDSGITVGTIVARALSYCRPSVRCVFFLFALATVAGPGCKKDVASDASDSDANGYLCLKCGAKLYTARTVFIGPKCPKCQEDRLVEVVGYRCAKDQFVTILPARGDSRSATCQICQASLGNAMFLPREKDLQAWGAAKAAP